MIYAQNTDNITISSHSGIDGGQYNIGISQETHDDEILNTDNLDLGKTKNKCVEGIIESSANDNNSIINPQDNISSNSNIKYSSSEILLNSNLGEEKLGISNNEILSDYGYDSSTTYSHDYDITFFNNDAKTFLSHFKYVSSGKLADNRTDINVIWTAIQNDYLFIVLDSSDVTKVNWVRFGNATTNIFAENNPNVASNTVYGGQKGQTTTIPGTDVSIGSNSHWMVVQIKVNNAFSSDIKINTDKGNPFPVTGFYAYYSTTTALTINPSSVKTTGTVTLKATVTDYNNHDVTSGTVNYYLSDGTLLGSSSSFNSGTTTFTFTPSNKNLNPGDYVIYAEYLENNQDHLFSSKSNNVNLNVQKIESSIAVSVDEVTYGTASTATISVNHAGTYKLNIDGNARSVSLNAGKNSVSLGSLSAGDNHQLTVSFTDDGYYTTASQSTIFKVNKALSTVNLNNINYTYGSTGTTTYSYSGASGITAKIYDSTGTTYIRDATVNSGSISISGLDAGNYILNVTTNPLSNYDSASVVKTITVNQATPTLEIVFNNVNSDNPTALHDGLFDLNYTHSINIGITITNGVTGTVTYTFDDGNTQLYENLQLSQRFNYTPQTITSSRDTTVTAVYSGDTNYKTVTVTKKFHISRHDVEISLDLDNVNDLKVGDKITITPNVYVDGEIISKGDKGSVVIQVNGENITTLNLNSKSNYEYTLNSNGEKKFTAIYLKNDYYRRATTENEIKVNVQTVTELTISVNNVTYGNASTATITTNAPGTYSYNIAGTT